MKGLGCTNALLTISHHHQTSLDAGMESNIVQFDFSAAFDIVSHSGLLFKLKSIGICRCVLSICRVFLSDHRQRFVVDGAASEFELDCLLCLSWLRTDYLPMQMIRHYWQLFTCQQTDLLLLPPLIGNPPMVTWSCLGFLSELVPNSTPLA